VNFRRLHLSVGFALILALATVAAGLAQTQLPPPPAPGATTPPAVVVPATPAPATAPSGAAVPATAAPALTTAAPTLATAAPLPAASASAGPRRGRRAPGPAASGSPAPGPSDTPEPPQFSTLDGIWEVEAQPLGKRLAVYSHLSIAITGPTISGYWEHDPHKTKSTMTGTFDGRLIQMTVTMPDGTTTQFSGYVENFADMVGLVRTSDKDPGMAFTAQHRKKNKA
jgi:hypothetical protein